MRGRSYTHLLLEHLHALSEARGAWLLAVEGLGRNLFNCGHDGEGESEELSMATPSFIRE